MSKIFIPKNELSNLYYKEKKSKYTIGKIYGCSFSTVLNRMRDYGMKPLPKYELMNRYVKNDFSGDKIEQAYLIGFRLGDLNVYRKSKESGFLVVRCHTTDLAQVDLLKRLFDKYGQVTVSEREGHYNVNCFLNKTFNFLLAKTTRVPVWIGKDIRQSLSFAAGYMDAEANIGVYDNRARLKVDSYDKNIIFWLAGLFKKIGVECQPPSKIGFAGQIYNKLHGYKYNKDLWRVRISKSNSLLILLNLIKPYLKHKNRINHLNKALINLNARRKNKQN